MSCLLVLFFVIFSVQLTEAKQIALSFDDAPMRDSYLYSGNVRTSKIIKSLKRHNVQAAFFATTQNLEVEQGWERMKEYANAGHLIANHTHSHPDLNSTAASGFISDIKVAHEKLKLFSTFKRWFRFPYLREGESLEKRDQLREFLKSNRYINGYVTIDNYDYFINKLVMDAVYAQQDVDFKKACKMLTDILIEGAEFYDKIARQHIGKVKHVLLLHENDLAAHCLDELILALRNSGWEIISPSQAYADPLLSREPATLFLGQGRVAAIAHEQSGEKFVSRWESTSALSDEFHRRGITQDN